MSFRKNLIIVDIFNECHMYDYIVFSLSLGRHRIPTMKVANNAILTDRF